MLRNLPIEQPSGKCSLVHHCSSQYSRPSFHFGSRPQSCNQYRRLEGSAVVARAENVNAAAAQADTESTTTSVPFGYFWYETMILLRSDLDAEKRDVELAKFEAFLKKEGAVSIDALVRANSQALAYPIKGFWDGIYVLYTYAAHPQTVRRAQKVLSTPAVGEESNILRHMTFRQ